MDFYRRRLPHVYEIGRPVFVTWRLRGSLPGNRVFPAPSLSSGAAFLALDRLLEETHCGPVYLRQPAVAEMVVEALRFNGGELGHYDLHAFVVMPNHVHLLVTPAVELAKLTRSLKGITAKRAMPCWESLDCRFGRRRVTTVWFGMGGSLGGFGDISRRILYALGW